MNTEKTSSDLTKIRILDASEYLFAQEGYRGTTLRAVTSRADVNLAAVNYHFGSKKTLVEEVIRRRIIPLNNIRRKRLEEVRARSEQKNRKPSIREVLTAFIEPTLHFKESHPESEHFFTFIGRSFTDPDDTVRDVFISHIRPIFNLLFELSCRALPEHDASLVYMKLHFSIGALFHTIHICGHLKGEFEHMDLKTDAEGLVEMIVPYVTAGMKA